MFGYITADPSQLSEEEIQRYSGCYCGLCRSLKDRYGLSGRMTLTYDLTFLILVLSSLYEPEETGAEIRCPMHPLKKRPIWQSSYTEYAADMNLLLAWWNCMDDWEDEKKVSRRALAGAIGKYRGEIEEKYPRQAAAISENIREIARYESGPEVSADRAADCFGLIMGELFVPRESDYWAPTLRAMGQGLGRFIYIMDACIDYKTDQRRHRPNPLLALGDGDRTREGDQDVLTMLLGDCTAAFEHLPLEQDLNLMRNILYAGVWQKYDQYFSRHTKRKGREGEGTT